MAGGARKLVAVEGVIGVGKTTLVHRLAEALSGRPVLEEFDENPFLPAFYRDPEAHALSTQLFFLMSRFRQQAQLLQADLFTPSIVADYLFDKDRIFAELTLAGDERRLYERLFSVLAPRVPRPDLVIYLRADLVAILDRIRARGRTYEQDIDPGYLQDLAHAYERFFGDYEAAPVLTVDTERLDLREDGPSFQAILRKIRTGEGPSHLDERGEVDGGLLG